ncbi:glutathione S-transferase family protein [Candidatus Haliotispira prima]|uniref:Glutathione S-transferase family protein n=1 Tax=Candidatus Haliotispira prima TaxID=3034016 RepID=A0ABY8MGH9_9SPIO|nr:glutathione S-transferase family protein [Candidatus Haliotispira prima]
MKDFLFYTNPMSRGQIARWALHEVSAQEPVYEERLLDFGEEMHSREFLAMNPMGKVPMLKDRRNDTIVTEAAAICLYLAEVFPEAGLKPEAPAELGTYLRWTFFASGPMEQAIISHHLKWDSGLEKSTHMTLGFGSYDLVTETLDSKLQQSPYVCGEQFTMADVYLGSQVDWGLQFGTLPKKESFVAYAENLRRREAYQQAKAIDNEYIRQQT